MARQCRATGAGFYGDGSARIVRKRQLSENVFRAEIEAPLIAQTREAGQFVIVSLDSERAERIPLTIADADPEAGTITLIWQRVGKTTSALSLLNEGDIIENVVGPLGQPTHVERVGTVVAVGGGIGIAPLYPIVKAIKAAGNRVVTILGARTKEMLILEDEMRAASDEVIVMTDDGSYGRQGVVTVPLREVCERDPKPGLCVAIGPAVMMKFCSEATRPFGVKTMVSLNTIMVDGTGMCGGCRISVGGESKFVCVDGPEFDGHQVDFEELIKRQLAYREQEREALEAFHKAES